ncbi:MAG: hypothetical protein HS115_17815 [Spirochaetales bacterium]|nr:hypothetical protein [Spirochaetales bacterium]
MAGVGVFFLVQLVYIVRHSRGFVWNRKEAISAVLTFGAVGAIFFYIYPGLVYLPAQFLLALSGFRVAFLRSVYPLVPDLKERN